MAVSAYRAGETPLVLPVAARRKPAPLELSRAVVPAFQSIQDREVGKLIN